MGGPDTQYAYPYNYFGDRPYKNCTLETPLNYGVLDKGIKIRDTMDTKAGRYCYTYA